MNALDVAVRRRVGERVRAFRRTRGLTQRRLSQRTGFSRSSIANLEAGRQNVTLRQLCALAEGLEVPVEALFA